MRSRPVLTRRQIMLGSGLLVATALIGRQLRQKPVTALSPDQAVLYAVVDTIVPKDEFPGALDIGLQHRLTERAATDQKLAEQVSLLVASIQKDASTGRRLPFDQLTETEREAMLTELLGQSTLPARAMRLVRSLVLKWYYESATGHQSLAYKLPSRYPAYRG